MSIPVQSREALLSGDHALTAPGGAGTSGDPEQLPEDVFLTVAYRILLDRAPDAGGVGHFRKRLAEGASRRDIVWEIRDSSEFRSRRQSPLAALHAARLAWTRSLPRAGTIVDLGGASTSSPRGALIEMGYPYDFESLTIIDLPPDERHEEFRSERWPDHVDTELGPVRYVHASMTDLSAIPDASVDLVNSSQTFEHIHPHEGEQVLAEVRRVLKPTGLLALDTPNRALTAIELADQDEEFINPDHKIEYTHPQMLTLFDRHGLSVVRAQGIAWLPESATTGVFDADEISTNAGLYDDIERSYLLAYLCRPTPGPLSRVRRRVESGIGRFRR